MIKKYVSAILVAAGLLSGFSANGASFDCAKASRPIEIAICSNDTLSKLDEDLALKYKTALAASSNPEALKASQLDWIKESRTCNTDIACLSAKYSARIAQLVSQGQMPPQLSSPSPTVQPSESVVGVNQAVQSAELNVPAKSESSSKDSPVANTTSGVVQPPINQQVSAPTQGDSAPVQAPAQTSESGSATAKDAAAMNEKTSQGKMPLANKVYLAFVVLVLIAVVVTPIVTASRAYASHNVPGSAVGVKDFKVSLINYLSYSAGAAVLAAVLAGNVGVVSDSASFGQLSVAFGILICGLLGVMFIAYWYGSNAVKIILNKKEGKIYVPAFFGFKSFEADEIVGATGSASIQTEGARNKFSGKFEITSTVTYTLILLLENGEEHKINFSSGSKRAAVLRMVADFAGLK